MIDGPILPEQEFAHERTGVTYVVSSSTHSFVMDETLLTTSTEPEEETLAKLGDGDEWTRAIVYYDPLRPNRTFVRDEAGFRQKFRRIN